MSPKARMILRLLVFIVSLIVVIYFQRTTGRVELLYMLMGLSGILWTLYDYNQGYN